MPTLRRSGNEALSDIPYYSARLICAVFLACLFNTAELAQTPNAATSIDNPQNATSQQATAPTAGRLPPALLTSVATYHNDPQRTGWNPNELVLTPSTVRTPSFGLLKVVSLDGRVDAQPLVVGIHKVEGGSAVYVVTENNTVYVINGTTGDVLLKRNLGPVLTTLPGGGQDGQTWCTSSTTVGINSTPTIDLSSETLFVMAATVTVAGVSEYQLHALDLATLADRLGSPVVVAASSPLENGTTFTFNAQYQRQRPALLESGGRIYAGFGSFGDCYAKLSRGWVLGWDKTSLAPLSANELLNRTPATAPNPFFLSSIWMSGYGLAADSAGDVYFTTGNSLSGTYNQLFNASESAVRLPAELGQILGVFTPANSDALDDDDNDFGSGGMMVLPDQSGPFPHLAVAGGKDGRLFVLNRDNLGGQHTPDIPNQVAMGGCWCGPSYFEGPHGPVVVTSGGTQLREWSIGIDNNLPSLSPVASSSIEASPHNPGFFTSISSNGTMPGTAVIWAVGHGSGKSNSVTLYAFDANPSGGSLRLLWSGAAGYWPWWYSNPNIVPTVANGHVYVASIQQLYIFGQELSNPVDAKRNSGRAPNVIPSGQ